MDEKIDEQKMNELAGSHATDDQKEQSEIRQDMHDFYLNAWEQKVFNKCNLKFTKSDNENDMGGTIEGTMNGQKIELKYSSTGNRFYGAINDIPISKDLAKDLWEKVRHMAEIQSGSDPNIEEIVQKAVADSIAKKLLNWES